MKKLGPWPPTRAIAKALGVRHYFTGKPCKNGHVAARSTNKSMCMQCCIENTRRIIERNPDRRKEIANRSAAKHLELQGDRYRAMRRERYHANPENGREASRKKAKARRDDNPEKERARCREQWHRHREKNLIRAKVSSNLRNGADGKFTADDIERKWTEQGGLCGYHWYCSNDLRVTGYHVDHIVALINGGSNWPENIQLLCPSCNCSKRADDPQEFVQKLLARKSAA